MTSGELLLVDSFDSYTHNLADLVHAAGWDRPRIVTADRVGPTDLDTAGAVLLSPGPGHPATEASFAEVLRGLRTTSTPVLGVCLGLQGIVVAWGGRVGEVDAAHGVRSTITHDDTGVLAGLPQDFSVVRYHSLAALEVPAELAVTARSSDGVVMAVRHRRLPQHGVQFHPESVLSDLGVRLMTGFLTGTGIARRRSPQRVRQVATARTSGRIAPVATEMPWLEPEVAAAVMLPPARRGFWLDSVRPGAGTGRWSYLGALGEDDESVVLTDPAPGAAFDVLADRLADPRPVTSPWFDGGWVTVLGYAAGDPPARTSPGPEPDAVLLRAREFLVFDQANQVVRAVGRDRAASIALRDELSDLMRSGTTVVAEEPQTPDSFPTAADGRDLASYARQFALIQAELARGTTYEAVLCRRLELMDDADPWQVYRRLRDLNPAPYGAWLRHDDLHVLSSSPELMLAVDEAGRVRARPIKGTTPRGRDAEQDALHRWRLGHDEHYLRENLMVTDMVRSDLSRVCLPGSVEVTELMAVHSYASVHQLVTTVEGDLDPAIGTIGAVRAAFPAASMTGAPRLRTMAVVDRTEPQARGLYSGALGWFGDDGRAELSVLIRALVGVPPQWSLGTGGGIVAGASAEEEFAESGWKASRLLSALRGRDVDSGAGSAGGSGPVHPAPGAQSP